MIIVSGTKRSGTSMWMQILKAAGLPILGTEFPKIWKDTIYEANPHGFYESQFRNGIYYRTNPHPKTGLYVRPSVSTRWAVKVFVPGLCRTEHGFITAVLGTVRDWREYGGSLDRLLSMEKTALEERTGKARDERPRLEPLLEWWMENFLLVRDIATRGYPARLISYDRVVSEPDVWIPKMLRWLAVKDEEAIAAAVATVDPGVRTQKATAPAHDLSEEQAAAFDLLYAVAHEGRALTAESIASLNTVHDALVARIEAQLAEVQRDAARRRARRRAAAEKPPRPIESEADFIDRLVTREDDESGDNGGESP